MKSVLNYVLRWSHEAGEGHWAVMDGQIAVELYCPPLAINMQIKISPEMKKKKITELTDYDTLMVSYLHLLVHWVNY